MSSLCSRVIMEENTVVSNSKIPVVIVSREFTVDTMNESFETRKFMNECENAQPVCNTRSNLPGETVFHAVYVPQDNNKDSVNIEEHIYQDLPDALKVIKEHKRARLKTFKNRSDAEAYSRTGYIQSHDSHPTTTVAVIQETCSSFKALKPQDLTIFKKLIEVGNVDNVRNIIWANPRYLISSGDTPEILQMGSRYNALHIAVKANKPDMCELILKTVGNPTFIQLNYGNNECKSYLNPAEIMLDLYLNTPDKGLNETPLHFAAKFGHKDIVRILVSYSQCIKTSLNKYNQQPIDIICTRKCQEDENLKQEIRSLLEDQYYVPVLRTKDNTCQPIVGEPFSPSSTFINSSKKSSESPISSRLEVRAFAGPMDKSQALEFQRKLKTPPRINFTAAKKGEGDAPNIMNSSAIISLRLQDMERGLEREGRDLAEKFRVSWMEYWSFLKDFVNFKKDEGLTKLEKYFEQSFNDFNNQLRYSRKIDSVNNTNTNVPTQNCQEVTEKMGALDVNEVQNLCEKLHSCSLNNKFDVEEDDEDTDNSEYQTPSSTPEYIYDSSDDDMQNAEEEGPMIFLGGFLPTDLDHNVYNELPSEISSNTYPYIYRWRHEMQLIIKRNPYRFNKKLSKRKLFTNNT